MNDIYSITKKGDFAKDYSLKDQIRRSGILVMLNIAEGFCRKSHKEFKQFLFYSHGSVGEIQSALYIAFDQEYISQKVFVELYAKMRRRFKDNFRINQIFVVFYLTQNSIFT